MTSKEYVNGEDNKAVDSFAEEDEPMKWKRERDQKLPSSSEQLADDKDMMTVTILTGGKSSTPPHRSGALMRAKFSVLSSPEQSDEDDDFESFAANGPPLLRAKEYIRFHELWKSTNKTKKQLDAQNEVVSVSGEKRDIGKENFVEEVVQSPSPQKRRIYKRLRKAKAPVRKKFRFLKDIYNEAEGELMV